MLASHTTHLTECNYTEQSVPKTNPEIWRKISSYELDSGTLTFTKRLFREQFEWSWQYTVRVVEEYRRFVYLSAISPDSVTPSEQVDQAWHLHILYMKMYEDFCRSSLNTMLIHGPTKGGSLERVRYFGQYEATKCLYAEEFGESPPGDIWPPVSKRFKNAGDLVWVCTSRYVVIRRSFLFWSSTLLLIACLALTAIY